MPMKVEVVWGSGTGETALGAVDAALAAAGIHNYNLVEYSSILPPDASIDSVDTYDGSHGVGAPVPVVLAVNIELDDNRVAAGIGWDIAAEGGVIYEASGETENGCRKTLETGLAEARRLRDWDWVGEPEYRVIEASVDAVVVAAVFPPLAYKSPP